VKHLCALALLILLFPALAFAQDRDNDGLPDEIEVKLGTDPGLDEGLQLIIDDKLRGQGDENIGIGTAPDVDKV